MAEDEDRARDDIRMVNTSLPGSTDGDGRAERVHGVDAPPGRRLDEAVLSLARLIGRQIAREHFEALQAANDNMPRRDQSEAAASATADREGNDKG